MHFINICRKSYALVHQIFRIFQSNSAYLLILAFNIAAHYGLRIII